MSESEHGLELEARRRAERRVELERWIAGSRRLQKRLVVIAPIGAAASVVAAVLYPIATPFVALTAVAYYFVGRYITAAHIADWRQQLRDLDRPPAPIEGREDG